jgi:predicted transposase/invertase (TIGR01784 family)
LYKALEIEQLTKEQMETYDKSILKYRDVRDAVEWAEEKYYARGIETGLKKEREAIAKKCLQKGMSIESISEITGLTFEQLLDIA